MRRYLLPMAAALMAGTAMPIAASAQDAITRADLNMRAGPSTAFPVVDVIPESAPVDVHGCVRGYTWCDVTSAGSRGWVSASYLSYARSGSYVPLAEYGPEIDLPIIAFSVGSYWDNYYRGRPWYAERTRWRDRWQGNWRDIRRNYRAEQREERRDDRAERRGDRREVQTERRQERSKAIRDRRSDAARTERREERREQVQKRRRESSAERRQERSETRDRRRETRTERSSRSRGASAERRSHVERRGQKSSQQRQRGARSSNDRGKQGRTERGGRRGREG